MSTGRESSGSQCGRMATVKRKFSTLLGEYNYVFRFVTRRFTELHFAIVLYQQSPELYILWSNISVLTTVINVTD